MNFYLLTIQMPGNSTLFKPSVTQPLNLWTDMVANERGQMLPRQGEMDENTYPFYQKM